MIALGCPHCGQGFDGQGVPEGLLVACPHCRGVLVLSGVWHGRAEIMAAAAGKPKGLTFLAVVTLVLGVGFCLCHCCVAGFLGLIRSGMPGMTRLLNEPGVQEVLETSSAVMLILIVMRLLMGILLICAGTGLLLRREWSPRCFIAAGLLWLLAIAGNVWSMGIEGEKLGRWIAENSWMLLYFIFGTGYLLRSEVRRYLNKTPTSKL